MSVKLIAYTQPVIQSEVWDAETGYQPLTISEFIGYVARVSNPTNQNNHLTAPKLLKYLANNKHWSPFEMANVVLEINTTRDIGRQILRHRSFSFQEFSQRYADPTNTEGLGFVTREARLQDTKNRQNSIETNNEDLKDTWETVQAESLYTAKLAYAWAIENGIAKEQARVVLPEGLTMSRMYMNGTVRSWIHYCQLRMSPGTQKEHREIATEAWEIINDLIPALKDVILEQ